MVWGLSFCFQGTLEKIVLYFTKNKLEDFCMQGDRC